MTDQPAKTDPPAVISVSELSQNVTGIIDRVNDTGRSVLVTWHGRFVASIAPMSDQKVISTALATGPLAEEVRRRADAFDEEGFLTTDEVLARLDDRRQPGD